MDYAPARGSTRLRQPPRTFDGDDFLRRRGFDAAGAAFVVRFAFDSGPVSQRKAIADTSQRAALRQAKQKLLVKPLWRFRHWFDAGYLRANVAAAVVMATVHVLIAHALARDQLGRRRTAAATLVVFQRELPAAPGFR